MIITDQTGYTLTVVKKPLRIVSLVPSITELLVDLGLSKNIVGVTKFCVHPENLKKISTVIGGTKKVNIEKVIAVQPELIISNKEENTEKTIEELRQICPVYTTDISTHMDIIHFIDELGSILPFHQAEYIKAKIKLSIPQKLFKNESVLYLIWQDPYMTIGGDTFIHHNLSLIGLNNIFAQYQRYPEVNFNQIDAPNFIFLSSEPFPFRVKHKEKIETLFPDSQVVLVNGEAFSWYGTRLMNLPYYFKELKKEIYD